MEPPPQAQHMSEETKSTSSWRPHQLGSFSGSMKAVRLEHAATGFLDAMRGSFQLPREDTAEPERTERLLRRHRYFCPMGAPARPSDKYALLGGMWLFRTNGHRGVTMYYQYVKVLLGVVLGARRLGRPLRLRHGPLLCRRRALLRAARGKARIEKY